MQRPAVILATRRPPFPLDNGARIRTQRLASGLAAEGLAVALVTFADGPTYDDAAATLEQLESVLPGVEVELVPYGRRHPGGLRRSAWRPASGTWGAYARPTLRRALAERLRRRPDAVLHLDDPGVGLAALRLPAGLVVFAPHNVEHRIVREVAATRPPSHRVFLELEWRKIRAEERRLWRGSDLCLAVSEIDAATMRAGGARAVALAPNGADPVDDPPPVPPPGDELRLLFVGTADYWPYEHGLGWFVREVMPRLDGVRFDIVGRPPERREEHPRVTYHGRVGDLGPHWAAAHALVIPVFQGSGTRLKAVEAAVMRRPIVSTRLGVEGLPLHEGEHYLRAEDPPAFVRAVERLRTLGPAERARMTDAAHAAVQPLLWPRVARDLADRYAAAQITRTR